MEAPRLPRLVEDEAGASHLVAELVARALPLWPGAEVRVAQAEITPVLAAALTNARATGHLVRGLEDAERMLTAEKRGLAHVDRKTGAKRGRRVSRLLVLADDGADRFYRSVESLLRQHAPRVLALRLTLDEGALGELLFGPGQVARLLLIEHKDAVSAVLMALATQWKGNDPPG
jgi:hypothetical protein